MPRYFLGSWEDSRTVLFWIFQCTQAPKARNGPLLKMGGNTKPVPSIKWSVLEPVREVDSLGQRDQMVYLVLDLLPSYSLKVLCWFATNT